MKDEDKTLICYNDWGQQQVFLPNWTINGYSFAMDYHTGTKPDPPTDRMCLSILPFEVFLNTKHTDGRRWPEKDTYNKAVCSEGPSHSADRVRELSTLSDELEELRGQSDRLEAQLVETTTT